MLTVEKRADGATEFRCDECKLGCAVSGVSDEKMAEVTAEASRAAIEAGCTHQA
jgi:ribonuclease PH